MFNQIDSQEMNSDQIDDNQVSHCPSEDCLMFFGLQSTVKTRKSRFMNILLIGDWGCTAFFQIRIKR